ncbi:MAG: NAD-dependent epimerase/dehydratase family protein [Candidatus Competibacteraceae bacterium]
MDVRAVENSYSERPVLVTGGTGFVGQQLVTELQTLGARVHVLVRPGRQVLLGGAGMETIAGDLADADSLARACTGIDTIIHAAGFAHADAANTPDFSARHWAINAEGVFRLLDAAVGAGVERFVFLSSIKAAGDPGARCVDETWNAPPETPYGQAKRAAEERVLAVGREYGRHVVNLRLALVYGPGMKGNLMRLLRAVQRGWFPPLPETGNRRSLVHVQDVVQAALLAAAHPVAAGQTYLVTDGQPYSGRELYVWACQALGRSAPGWAVPASVLQSVAGVADRLGYLCGRRDGSARTALDKLLGWACYNSARLGSELGYQPVWTLYRYGEVLAQKLRERRNGRG